MPARVRNVNDVASLNLEVAGVEPGQTSAQRREERRAHAPDATQFVAQTRKIPSTQPETVRRVLGKAKWFQEYVEDVSPELSMLSASLQHMPRESCHLLNFCHDAKKYSALSPAHEMAV